MALAKNSKAMKFTPDEVMTGGGLPDDFDGTVERIRFTAHNWPSQDEPDGATEWRCVIVAYIQPDEGELEDIGEDLLTEDGLVRAYYSLGSEKTATIEHHFMPSPDGVEPVDLSDPNDPVSWEGIAMIPVGDRRRIAGGSNGLEFLKHWGELGKPFTGDLSIYDGVSAHFDRVTIDRGEKFNPQRRRGQSEDEPVKVGDVLVPTKLLKGGTKGASKKKTASKKKGAKKASKKAETVEPTDNGALDTWLTELVAEAVADGAVDHFDALPKLVLKGWKGRPDDVDVPMKQAREYVQSDEFLGSGPWTMDDDGGLAID